MLDFGGKTRRRRPTSHKKHANKQGKKQVTIGLVYAEWCGHCQALKPEWKHMKDEIAKNPKLRNQCKIIEYESEQPMPPKIKGMVEGYPTIFSIDHRGGLKKYEGGRSSAELLEYVNQTVQSGGKREEEQEHDREQGREHEQDNGMFGPLFGGKRLRKSGKRKSAKRRK
jgi:thiol-disulfide isomerase/thioredoxin